MLYQFNNIALLSIMGMIFHMGSYANTTKASVNSNNNTLLTSTIEDGKVRVDSRGAQQKKEEGYSIHLQDLLLRILILTSSVICSFGKHMKEAWALQLKIKPLISLLQPATTTYKILMSSI